MSSVQPYRGSYLMPSVEHATVSDVMRPGVMSCPPDAAVTTIAQTMATHHIHAVVVGGVHTDVVHGDELVWAILSDLDLAHAVAIGADEATAGDIARTAAPVVDPGTPLREAAQIMDKQRAAHLVVVDRGRPVGMVSTLDIAGAVAWGRG